MRIYFIDKSQQPVGENKLYKIGTQSSSTSQEILHVHPRFFTGNVFLSSLAYFMDILHAHSQFKK